MKGFTATVLKWVLPIVMAVLPGLPGAAMADVLAIQGTPLEIRAFEDSTMGVFRWQSQWGDYYCSIMNETQTECLVRQYYAEYSKGSLIFLNGADPGFIWGGEYFDVTAFTPVSHVMPDPWTIQTVYDAGESGVRITQTVSYTNGNSYYQIVWTIANTGETTYNDVRFIHEGDTYFSGDDSSVGHWNEGLGMVYLTNPDPALTGIMGLYGGIASPATHHIEDEYDTAWEKAISGSLPDTIFSEVYPESDPYHDAGYALQWNRQSLAPGQTWTITAFEKWTESGYVQVIAPAQTPIIPGGTISMDFQIQNYQDVADTFTLELTSASGWTVSLPGENSVTVPANSLITVETTVQAPADAQDEFEETITLTATSQSDPEISNSDAVSVVVEPPATTKPIGPGSQVADYEMMSFVHYPLNPAATSVIGLPVDGNNLRAGTYDPQTGGYIEYGDDLQIIPGKAYWALSREGFNVSFTGTKVPMDEDFKLELAYNATTGDGWNQIGCPNEAVYDWADVQVVVYDDEGGTIFGPAPISEMTDPNEYIDLRLWRWENGGYLDDTAFMEPYNGYWARAKHAHVFLIFPVNAQSEPGGFIEVRTVLRNKLLLAKRWIFSPRTAIAAAGDSPPMPMTSLDSEDGGASSSGGGGCFIDAVAQEF